MYSARLGRLASLLVEPKKTQCLQTLTPDSAYCILPVKESHSEGQHISVMIMFTVFRFSVVMRS
jgi:hypothetical protein